MAPFALPRPASPKRTCTSGRIEMLAWRWQRKSRVERSCLRTQKRDVNSADDGPADWEYAAADDTPWIDEEVEDKSFGLGGVAPLQSLKRSIARARPNLGIAAEFNFLALSAAVGFLTGVSVTIFKIVINLIKSYLYGDFIGHFPIEVSQAVVACVPLLGAAAVVALRRWIKDFGPGLSGLVEEVDKQAPFNLGRSVAKAVAAICTLGTGNSLGPEGPAVELGVGSSRFVAQWTNLSVEKQRLLLGAGAAAGVAAGFNAPIAGVFFALEIVRDSFGSGQFISKSGIAATLLCAAVSALTARTGLHEEYALTPAPYHLESPLVELPFYLGLGFLSGLVAATFRFLMAKSGEVFSGKARGFHWMQDVPWWAKPLMGAAATGIVGLFYPQVLFFGYDTLDNLLANTGRYEPLTLLALCFWKALVTAICLGSGLVGGTFAPSLFLGATAGAAYQKLLVRVVSAARGAMVPSLTHLGTQLHPLLAGLGFAGATDLSGLLRVAEAPAYAMVGAASVLAAVYRAPLTSSLLLFELTEEYEIILPLMASAGVGSLLVELVQTRKGSSIQAAQTGQGDEMPLEMGNPVQKKAELLLASIPLQEALVSQVLVVTERTPVAAAVEALRRARSEIMLVVECPDLPDGVTELLAETLALRRDLHLLGIASLRDIMTHADQGPLVQATINTQVPSVASLFDPNGKPSAAADLGMAAETTAVAVAAAAAARSHQTIVGCYRRECFTVAPTASLAEARALMNARGVRYLPVVQGIDVVEEPMDENLDERPREEEDELAEGALPSLAGTTAAAAGAKRSFCVGLVSLESLRVALRLRETEQALLFGADAAAAAAASAAAATGPEPLPVSAGH